MGKGHIKILLITGMLIALLLVPYTSALSAFRYTVQRGDSLFTIASRFNTTISNIRSLNNKWDNHLNIGEILLIPSRPTQGQGYYVEPGDSLYRIARQAGISLNALRQANNIWHNSIQVGQFLHIPHGSSTNNTYTVKAGDTLYLIARNFGTTVSALMSVNGLTSHTIWPGQTLVVPSSGSSNPVETGNKVVVDPGHGGSNSGAVAYTSSGLLKESDIVLDVSKRLITLLNQNGYNTATTRASDSNVGLWDRVHISNEENPDVFVSIHADSNPNYPHTEGSNVYIATNACNSTYQLALTVQRHLERITGRSTNSLGQVVRRNFVVLMQSRPAILVETGFLSNAQDRWRFQTSEFRDQLARGIYNGISEWMQSR